MATEIELKAHVQDSGALRLLLTEKTEYKNAYTKEDSYWLNEAIQAESPLKVRVRREERTFPDGKTESVVLVTYKNKEVRDGIEINDEEEFEVQPGPEFEKLLRRMGFKPDIAKRKRGWAFCESQIPEGCKRAITAELSEVEGLGWFIELEILADNSREETVAEGRNRLLSFLASLGIEKEAIESRYYTEMLKENEE